MDETNATICVLSSTIEPKLNKVGWIQGVIEYFGNYEEEV